MEKNQLKNAIKYDVLIVGGGPVGLYATYLSSYLKMKTLLVEIDSELGGLPRKIFPNKTIPNFPFLSDENNKIIVGEKLIKMLENLAFNNLTTIKTNTEIKNIFNKKDDYFEVEINDNQKIYARYIILTIGKGTWKFKEIDKNIIKNNLIDIHYKPYPYNEYNNKNIIVLGGGDGAIDYAFNIKNNSQAKSVSLIHHKDTFTSINASKEAIKQQNINLLLNYSLIEISNKIILKNNSTQELLDVEADAILVQFGTEMIGASELIKLFKTNNNLIVVDENYQTSIDGIYAAGACIDKKNRINMIMMGISEVTMILNTIKSLIPNSEKVYW